MNKRKVSGSLAAIIGLVCLGVGLLLVFGSYSFTLTEEQIQTKVDAKMPVEKSGITIAAVGFDLSQDDVTVLATGAIEKLGEAYTFEIRAVGVPSYRFTTGEFYFTPRDVEIISLEQTSDSAIGGAIKGFADKYLTDDNKIGVKLKTLVTDAAGKIEEWIQKGVEAGAEYALERVPVYTLPDDTKGFLARAVLDDVAVKDGTLSIKLSLMRLTIWVLLLIVGAVASLGFLVALARNPGLLAGALLVGSLGE